MVDCMPNVSTLYLPFRRSHMSDVTMALVLRNRALQQVTPGRHVHVYTELASNPGHPTLHQEMQARWSPGHQ